MRKNDTVFHFKVKFSKFQIVVQVYKYISTISAQKIGATVQLKKKKKINKSSLK